MNRKVLIISPHFPPSNAADMQRIRMSLPYFKDYGWDAEVVVVDDRHSEIVKDDLLLQSLPDDIKIHTVQALPKKWTSKVGLGSLALRSMWYYRKKVNQILRGQKFDLIYFSTTNFPLCILGAYWKNRFGIPYIIDMQDPWHSNYYRDKPKNEQPPKYWFSYRLNKYLEPVAMKSVDGLISVSESYINDLKERYAEIQDVKSVTIPFGAFKPDFDIAKKYQAEFVPMLETGHTNIVYIGRGGADMHKALHTTFSAFKNTLAINPETLKKVKLYFLGTSYAPQGRGKQTVLPIAEQYGIEQYVVEQTDRISYYHTLVMLQQADALFIPGSDDPKYTASKIYPYILVNKPLLAIFNAKSPALKVLKEYGVPFAYSYDGTPEIDKKLETFFIQVSTGNIAKQQYCETAIAKYAAENMTKQQCLFFDEVISK